MTNVFSKQVVSSINFVFAPQKVEAQAWCYHLPQPSTVIDLEHSIDIYIVSHESITLYQLSQHSFIIQSCTDRKGDMIPSLCLF